MESSSVYQPILLSKSSFKPSIFRFTQTTKCLQPVTATHIFPPCAIKCHKIHEYLRGKWPTVSLSYYLQGKFVDWVISLLFWMKFLAYCGFADKFIQVVSPNSFQFLFMPTRWPGQAQAQTPPNIQSLACLFFQCQKNFNFMTCFEVIIIKKTDQKSILG